MKICGCSALNHSNHIGKDCPLEGLPEFDGFCKECKIANDTDDAMDHNRTEKEKIRNALS